MRRLLACTSGARANLSAPETSPVSGSSVGSGALLLGLTNNPVKKTVLNHRPVRKKKGKLGLNMVSKSFFYFSLH